MEGEKVREEQEESEKKIGMERAHSPSLCRCVSLMSSW